MRLQGKRSGFHLKQRQKDAIFVFLMVLIPLAHFCVFWISTNLNAILMAFKTPNSDEFTLINFERFWNLLTEDRSSLLNSLTNTIVLFIVGTFVNLPLVMFLSYVLFKKIAGYKIFRVIFYLPVILGGSVTAALYRYMVSNGGPVEVVLDWLGVEYNKQLGLLGNPDTVFMMIIIYTIWTAVGTNMIMLSGAMHRIPEDIFESARIDGVGFFREFFQIIVPLIWPTVTTMLIFGVAGMFSTSTASMLLAPGTPEASTIGWYITRYTMAAGNGLGKEVYNYPAAVGLVFTLIGTPLVLFTKWICEKIARNVEY